ncbi:MAG: hypothetical protein ACLSBB_14215 [Ruthenibacterium lactatiformans]
MHPQPGGNIDQAVALLNWWINSPEANEIIMAERACPLPARLPNH